MDASNNGLTFSPETHKRLAEYVRERCREYASCNGGSVEAAKILGVKQTTFSNMMSEKRGLRVPFYQVALLVNRMGMKMSEVMDKIGDLEAAAIYRLLESSASKEDLMKLESYGEAGVKAFDAAVKMALAMLKR